MTSLQQQPNPTGEPWELEAAERTPRVRARWRELAEDSGNLFASEEWVEAWWRHLGRDEERLLFACVGAGSQIAALLPMAVGRLGPLSTLRFAGHGPADAQGPVCAPENGLRALKMLAEGRLGNRLLLADRYPADLGCPQGFVELRREASPIIDLADGWEGYLRSRSSNLRSQVRRKERKLQRESGLVYRLADAASLEDDMEALFRLHQARWGGQSSGAFAGPGAAFHKEFARVAHTRGWLRLWVAEIGAGEPIAVWYGFRFAGQEWYYQSGRDPAWDRSSIGQVLLAHTMRSAAEDGIECYRLLRGGEAYKGRFATSDRPVMTMGSAGGIAGRAALRIARTAVQYPGARRWLRRLG